MDGKLILFPKWYNARRGDIVSVDFFGEAVIVGSVIEAKGGSMVINSPAGRVEVFSPGLGKIRLISRGEKHDSCSE